MPFNLLKELEKILPQSSGSYELLNVQSKPHESKPAIHKPPNHKPIKSIKVEHLFTLFMNKAPLLALEILVNITIPSDYGKVERLIYISKADTTGLNPQLGVKTRVVIQCFLRWLLLYPINRYFNDLENKQELDYYSCITKPHEPFVSTTHRALHILVERTRGDLLYGIPKAKKPENQNGTDQKMIDLLNDSTKHLTRVVLFTRSEPQYLFPNSDQNKTKHILTDSQLLKWWMNTINGVLGDFDDVLQKKLNILNSEVLQIKKFFPQSNDSVPWNVGDIYTNKENPHDTAVYHIPLLPDDPKGRFLEHLVVENRIKKVKVRQFWTELSIRQEFRLGIIVGLIGVEGVTKNEFSEEFICGLTIVKKSTFKKIKKIMMEVDYSDSNEEQDKLFNDLHDELNGVMDNQDWISEIEVKRAPDTSTNTLLIPTNTINVLSVCSKKNPLTMENSNVTPNPVDIIKVNTLTVRSKKNSNSSTSTPTINVLTARSKKSKNELETVQPNLYQTTKVSIKKQRVE